jgi:hypothetical protein
MIVWMLAWAALREKGGREGMELDARFSGSSMRVWAIRRLERSGFFGEQRSCVITGISAEIWRLEKAVERWSSLSMDYKT